jgi:hypothetical protein
MRGRGAKQLTIEVKETHHCKSISIAKFCRPDARSLCCQFGSNKLDQGMPVAHERSPAALCMIFLSRLVNAINQGKSKSSNLKSSFEILGPYKPPEFTRLSVGSASERSVLLIIHKQFHKRVLYVATTPQIFFDKLRNCCLPPKRAYIYFN